MGKKNAPAPPPVPDPLEIARVDADFNRINQYTPLGSLEYTGPNKNVATLTLTPELEGLLGQQQGIDTELLSQSLARLQGMDLDQIDLSQFGPIESNLDLSSLNQLQGVDFSGLPALRDIDLSGLPGIPQNIEQYRGDVEDAYFNRARRLLDPQIARQNEAQQQRLANQGLPQTSGAYLAERTNFEDARNRTYSDLADQAVLRGGQEASRQLANILAARGQGVSEQLGLFGAGLQGRGLLSNEQLQQAGFNNQNLLTNLGFQQQNLVNQNAARTQALNEAMGIRGNAFNELASLLGLQQVAQPGLTNFFAPSQVDTGLGYQLSQQQANANYQGALQQQQGMLGGLFGLGAAALTGGFGNGGNSFLGGLLGMNG